MTIPAIILTTIVCLGLAALIVCALIGLMAMVDFAKFFMEFIQSAVVRQVHPASPRKTR